MTLSSAATIPLWSMVVLLILLSGLAWYAYRHNVKAAGIFRRIPLLVRIMAFVAIGLVLLDLKFSWSSSLAATPLVKVFFDNSVSTLYHQSVSRESLKRGYEDFANGLRRFFVETPGDVDIQFYSFGAKPTPLAGHGYSFDFDQPTTNIAALFQELEVRSPDRFLAGIVVVSDGQVTMGEDPLQVAEKLEVPVYTVGIGQETPMVDVRISKIEAPTVGIKGESISARIHISSVGSFQERVNVTLAKRGKLIGSRTVSLSGHGSANTVRFRFELDEIGKQEFSVRVSSIKDEINVENNRSSFEITTLKNRFKVALVTGIPTPNTSFVKRVLRSEKRFKIDHFVHSLKGWKPPIAEFWRSKYDLVILDNFPNRNTPVRWVDALERKLESLEPAFCLIAGPNVDRSSVRNFYPLLGLQQLPGSSETMNRYLLEFSNHSRYSSIMAVPAGGLNPLVSAMELPPLQPFLFVEPSTDEVSPLVVLDAAYPIPLLCMGQVSTPERKRAGRVAAFSAAHLWRLHFRIMNSGYSSFVEQWWSRIFNWLVKSTGDNDMYFRLNKQVFQQGESIEAAGTVLDLDRERFRDGEVILKVLANGETIGTYPLAYSVRADQWEGTFFASRPGTYDYVIEAYKSGVLKGTSDGSFRVRESQIELNNVYLNRGLLQELANATGGNYVDWQNREDLIGRIDLESRNVILSHSLNLSRWVPLGILLLLLLVAEWIFRRFSGLL